MASTAFISGPDGAEADTQAASTHKRDCPGDWVGGLKLLYRGHMGRDMHGYTGIPRV